MCLPSWNGLKGEGASRIDDELMYFVVLLLLRLPLCVFVAGLLLRCSSVQGQKTESRRYLFIIYLYKKYG